MAKFLVAKYDLLAAAPAAVDVDAVAPASGGGVGWLGRSTAISSSSRTRRSGGGRGWPVGIVLRRFGGDGTVGVGAAEDEG